MLCAKGVEMDFSRTFSATVSQTLCNFQTPFPPSPNNLLPEAVVSIPCWALPLACPLCNGTWSHHGSPGAWPGLVGWLAEEISSQQKLHLSSGAWQASKRLVGNNTWVHTTRRVSQYPTGRAVAWEDLAQTTSLHSTLGTHVRILVLTQVDIEFEEGCHPKDVP